MPKNVSTSIKDKNKSSLKKLLSEKIAFKSSIYISLVLNFLNLLLVLILQKNLPPQIPLFYSLPWGEEQLAPSIALLLLPLGIFLIALLNSFLIMASLSKYFLAAKILIWITVCLIFLTGVNLVKVVFLIY